MSSLTRGLGVNAHPASPSFAIIERAYRDLPRTTTAIILGAVLTFPFLAPILKATDANVTRSNWPKHCHNSYSQRRVVTSASELLILLLIRGGDL